MAKEVKAVLAKKRAFDYLQKEVGVRPYAVGITESDAGEFGLSVSFPREPSRELPSTVLGVPVEYYIGERPQLTGLGRAGKKLAAWRTKLLGQGS